MDRATEIAHRIIPDAGSEWPLSEHGRAVVLSRAADIIRAEIEQLRDALQAAEKTYAALERNRTHVVDALHAKGHPASWLVAEIAKADKIRAALNS